MSLSPKSNTAYLAIDKAYTEALNKDIGEMPSYLKSPYNGYLYPHNYKNSIVKQTYLPKNIEKSKYYIPKESSKYETSLKTIYEKIQKIKGE